MNIKINETMTRGAKITHYKIKIHKCESFNLSARWAMNVTRSLPATFPSSGPFIIFHHVCMIRLKTKRAV